MMKNLNSNKKGVALLTVVLFFLVMVILLGGLLFATVNNLKNTQTAQKHTSVYYAAESGINLQVAKFLDLFEQAKTNKWPLATLQFHINALKDTINDTDNSLILKDNMDNPVSSVVSIDGPFSDPALPNYTFYSIESIGTIGGVQRTLTTNFGYEYKVGSGVLMPISGAVIANAGVNVQNGTITGAIASNLVGTSVLDIRNVNCSLIPTITIPASDTSPCSNKVVLTKPIVFSDVTLPTYPSLSSLKEVTLSGNTLTLPDPDTQIGKPKGYFINNVYPDGKLTINLGSWATDIENVILRVTGTWDFGREIEVTGTGNLLVLMDHTSSINISAPINQNLSDPTKFLLVLKSNNGNQDIRISNGNTVVASILSDSTANITWNKANFFGFLVTNSGYTDGDGDADDYDGWVSISAGSSIGGTAKPPIWVYAPHATVDIQAANTTFYGTVMANAVEMNANKGGIVYVGATTEYPFSDWTILPGVPSGELAPTDIEYRITPIKEN